jgi:hypothetical protein
MQHSAKLGGFVVYVLPESTWIIASVSFKLQFNKEYGWVGKQAINYKCNAVRQMLWVCFCYTMRQPI